jgi:hypothetical protein
MSRSKHQTYKKVFGDKSAAEIDAMFAEGDEDALEFLEKRRVKSKVRQKRQQGKLRTEYGALSTSSQTFPVKTKALGTRPAALPR